MCVWGGAAGSWGAGGGSAAAAPHSLGKGAGCLLDGASPSPPPFLQGYLSSGRRHARPVPGGPRRGGGKAAKSGEHAVVGTPPLHRQPSFHTPNANGGRKARPSSSGGPSGGGGAGPSAFGTSPGLSANLAGSSPGSGIYGSSPSGSGRRARRNAKRAAMDASLQQLGFAPPAGAMSPALAVAGAGPSAAAGS